MSPGLTGLAVALLSLMTASALADALLEDFHVLQKPKGDHGYRGIMGDFAQLEDGSILLSYTDGDLMVLRSVDGGRTWSEPSVLMPRPAPPARGTVCHPSFLRLPDGNLMLTYIYTTYPVTPYFATNYYRLSADEGETWTEPYCYTPYPGYVQVHNDRLATLSTGRIIATAEGKGYLPSTEDHSGYVGLTFFSDDGGFSWQSSKNTVDLFGEQRIEVQEADVVELKDGRLLMFARTYSGHPVFAYSEDKGETWGPGALRTDIAMPYAGLPTVRRIPSTGDLLFIWIDEHAQDPVNPQIHRRCALATAISRDEGETLTNVRHIARDPLDDFGYQCVEFLADGAVLVGYHARDGIHVARIGVEWFYGQ
jgi:sialidase-1